MKERPFKSFIDLVSFDQEIRSLLREMEGIEYEIGNLEARQKKATQDIEAEKNKVVALRKKVDEQELELKELDQLERDKKQLLEKIANYKEYQSVKTEVESIQQAQLNQEQAVLSAWNNLEEAQKAVKEGKAAQDKEAVTIKKSIEEKKQKVNSLQGELTTYKQKRPEKEKLVPKEWLEKYTVMKARVADPVVPIKRGACSACFYTLTDQDTIRARKGALLQCKGCYRLLYLLEAMEKETLNK